MRSRRGHGKPLQGFFFLTFFILYFIFVSATTSFLTTTTMTDNDQAQTLPTCPQTPNPLNVSAAVGAAGGA